VTDFDANADVVVVGTGIGGLVATVRAALDGARTITLEAAEIIGGTTRKAFGGLWVLNNHHMHRLGLEDPEEDALRYMARLSRPGSYDADSPTLGLADWEYEALRVFYQHGAEAVEDFEKAGVLKTLAMVPFPDYYAHLPENAAPHGRLILPKRGAGTPQGGQFLVEGLAEEARGLGADIRTGHRVVDLVVEDRRVVGVIAEGPGGETVRIAAAGGVIFCSGGFVHNPELRQEYLEAPYLPGCAAMDNDGQLLVLARRLGARLSNMAFPWRAPIVAEVQMREPESVESTFHIPGDGFLAVNRAGHRAVNEKAPYNEFTRAFFASGALVADYPNLPLILIWDERQAQSYGIPAEGNPFPEAGNDGYWVISAPTLRELSPLVDARLRELSERFPAARLADDFDTNLEASVARFAALARGGEDLDFGRGATEYERYISSFYGVGKGPNPTMRPLDEEGPFHATVLGPAAFDTKGGPRTDRHARVLDNEDAPIEGLYAAGNCAASPSVEAYWGAGTTLGLAFCFADLAARHAVERTKDLTAAP
jgi:succinate dehydrogenase/fumarate reductase flavoprotein subunit